MDALIRQAVVLAGGRGTRLGALTDSTPKPMLPVCGRPFLEHVLENLRRFGVTQVVFSVGYYAEVIRQHFGDGQRLGIRIDYIHEDEPAGTAGFLQLGRDLLGDWFYVLNGDTLFDVNLLALAAARTPTTQAVMALREVDDRSRYGAVLTSGSQVTAMGEKAATGPGTINGGIYLLARSGLDLWADPQGTPLPLSMEQTVLPTLIAAGSVVGVPSSGFFLDIGTPESFAGASDQVARWLRRPAAFLDRDGVINVDHGYVHKPADFQFLPGAAQAIRLLNECGYWVFVVTNQAGIAKGIYQHEDFARLTVHMHQELARHGAHVDAVYHCPHHIEGVRPELTTACDCRKPGNAMLLGALEQYPVELAGSFLLGDKPSDIEAATRTGIPGYLVTDHPSVLACVETILQVEQRTTGAARTKKAQG